MIDGDSGNSYNTNELVVHRNPQTLELSIYRAKGSPNEQSSLDIIGDEPGKSIHWELICNCKSIGFTPTPISTPSPVVTPTSTYISPVITPTPSITEYFDCTDENNKWNPDKIINPGEPHYVYGDMVVHNGKVYTVRSKHGVEKNDIPGISNHWVFLNECEECVCIPSNYTTWVKDENISLSGGTLDGFIQGLKFSFDYSRLENSNTDQTIRLNLQNSNIEGSVTFNKKKIPFKGCLFM